MTQCKTFHAFSRTGNIMNRVICKDEYAINIKCEWPALRESQTVMVDQNLVNPGDYPVFGFQEMGFSTIIYS